MSRGPGVVQMAVLRSLLLDRHGPVAVTAGDRSIWRGMAGIAQVVRGEIPSADRAQVRRAVRALEWAGYVNVARGFPITDQDGRPVGHQQNLVRLTDQGMEYIAQRGAL